MDLGPLSPAAAYQRPNAVVDFQLVRVQELVPNAVVDLQIELECPGAVVLAYLSKHTALLTIRMQKALGSQAFVATKT